jgi:oligosaccharide repeat unit polymerase
VIEVLIAAVVIWHYLRRPISLRKIGRTIAVAVLVIMIMTGFRKNTNEVSELVPYLTGEKILEILVGNRNLLGIDKTTYITDAIPGKMHYEFGKTLFLWLVAPVPRAIWTEKPTIAAGDIIGKAIYTNDPAAGAVGGVPPGLVVELFWNFGILGIPIGMFLLGLFLKIVYRSFKDQLSTNKNAVLVYVSLVVPFAFTLLGSNASGTMISLIKSISIVWLALLFVRR